MKLIFPISYYLTNRQVANIRKAFANNSSADIMLSKTQLSKMIQSGGFLDRLLKAGSPLIKMWLNHYLRVFFIPLGLTAAASAADAGIHKKTLGSGNPLSSLDYCENNKERLEKQATDKYRNLSEEKNKKREYGKNRCSNMSDEEKKRKEYQKNYREAKKSQHIIIK